MRNRPGVETYCDIGISMTASTRATAAPVIPLEKLEELWEIFCPNEQGYSAAMNFARAVEAESLKLQPIQQHSGNPASTGRWVPLEPTDAMMDAAEACSNDWPRTTWKAAWAAMLAAAPSPHSPVGAKEQDK